MKLLVYVFDSFKCKDDLLILDKELVVVRKLKTDIEKIYNSLLKTKADLVVGVARSGRQSICELVAINNIHGHKIDKNSEDCLDLFVPSPTPFSLSKRPTNSFCNYTMYKFAKFIKDKQLHTKLMFVHMREDDVDKLVAWLKNIVDG